ncbi:hypothetical protein SBRY_80238 [Actinacidiphila bryophytorum]|uniref:Uncharacterized protein n=1 Tax=Actinacidiphila bryophytorum TaxID=1436133 RepID=A0A9W4H867_9ACTN|nr:hypothetical protein SBRY_80238 [Actinacidiphila bryophytorum]
MPRTCLVCASYVPEPGNYHR